MNYVPMEYRRGQWKQNAQEQNVKEQNTQNISSKHKIPKISECSKPQKAQIIKCPKLKNIQTYKMSKNVQDDKIFKKF